MVDELSGEEAAGVLLLDPDVSCALGAFGRKGTGKSHALTQLFREYPYDRLLVDSTGDVDPDFSFTEPWPYPLLEEGWPEAEDGGRASYRLRPNRRLPTERRGNRSEPVWRWQVDDATGLVMDHGRTALFYDDAADTVPAGRILPNTDDMLSTLRHRHVSLFVTGPRPVGIDPRVLSQLDKVLMFDMPHELDVRRLAVTLGLPDRELYGLIRALDEHEFVLYDSKEHHLYHCDALP